MNAFLRHELRRPKEKLRRRVVPGAGTFGAPSAWLFLVRLHACRAGLRFTRHLQCRLRWLGEQSIDTRLSLGQTGFHPSCSKETCS